MHIKGRHRQLAIANSDSPKTWTVVIQHHSSPSPPFGWGIHHIGGLPYRQESLSHVMACRMAGMLAWPCLQASPSSFILVFLWAWSPQRRLPPTEGIWYIALRCSFTGRASHWSASRTSGATGIVDHHCQERLEVELTMPTFDPSPWCAWLWMDTYSCTPSL